MTTAVAALVSVHAFAACGSDSGADGGPSDGATVPTDAPSESGAEAGIDATSDAPGDAPGDADAAPAECTTKPFPTGCTIQATSVPATGAFGAPGTFAVTIETLANPQASAPLPISIYRPTGQTAVPVIFVSHAFGATKVASYDELLRRLASNGIAAVYVPYTTLNTTNAARYTELWEGFLAAATTYAATFDLTRAGFIGHSFGGGATPEMARRGFVEQGWGTNGRFMFIMAPWYSCGSGYDTLPADVRTVVQVYADDEANDHQIAVADIWNKLPAAMERRWQMIRSDACDCGLTAIHTVPASASQTDPTSNSKLDALDVWGVHRRILALAKYSFTSNVAARAVAYGADTAMGTWTGCGGRAVRPLEASTMPIVATCQALLYPYSKRCENADPDVVCP